MKQIIEYRIVYISEYILENLETGVNNLIEEGFQPFGSPCVTAKTEAGMIACQVMVKYKED